MSEEENLDGYIRVTSILYPFSGLQNIDPTVLAFACERGTKVHLICEAIAKGIGEMGVDEQTWGYVESFKNWWGAGQNVVSIEERFFDEDLKITGKVDLIIDTPDGKAVVDLKTSAKPSKTWPLQGNAYAYLAKRGGHEIKKIFFLHLNKHGKAPKVYEYEIDESFFLSLVRVYKHFFHKEKHE